MTPEARSLIDEIESLRIRLIVPIDKEMRAGGWREESALRIADALKDFGNKVSLIGDLPPMSERPWDMLRGLDSHGIHGGGPFDDLVEFGRKLRRLP